MIYTTNIIEGYHRQLRKVTKTKTAYPSDEVLRKIIYLATVDAAKKGLCLSDIGQTVFRN
jgi:transposase-like protein